MARVHTGIHSSPGPYAVICPPYSQSQDKRLEDLERPREVSLTPRNGATSPKQCLQRLRPKTSVPEGDSYYTSEG